MPKLNLNRPNRSRPKPAGRPLAYRLVDLPPLVGISQSGLRNMIAEGRLRAIRHGRVVLVRAAEVDRLVGGEG